MQILIERDGGATRIPKEVADVEEALAFEQQGFTVYAVDDDGEAALLSRAAADGEQAAEPAAPAKAAAAPKAASKRAKA